MAIDDKNGTTAVVDILGDAPTVDDSSASQQQQEQQQQQQQQTPPAMDDNSSDPQYAGHRDEAQFLGRWVLVDSKMSTKFIRWTSCEMIITREVNETTGKVEYHTKTNWKLNFCFCCCISGSATSISSYTSNDTFTVSHDKTNILEGGVDYGKKVGDKFISVGKKGTNEIEYRGDRCYMKIVDARYSLVSTLEYERVETFTY